MRPPKAFDEPIYVTRPLLPPLEEYTALLRQVWDSGWLTNGGRQHAELELELAHYLGAEQLSLFNNGTIALIVACQALRLSGEVIRILRTPEMGKRVVRDGYEVVASPPAQFRADMQNEEAVLAQVIRQQGLKAQ